jgi:hypothetical protein
MNLFYNIPQSFHPETRHSIRKVMERFVSESFQDDNIVDIPSLNRTTATLALIAATSFLVAGGAKRSPQPKRYSGKQEKAP